MSNLSLTEIIHEKISTESLRLPVYPAIIQQFQQTDQQALQEPQIHQLVRKDLALASQIFRAANSSFFRGLPKAVTIADATTRLGVDKTRELLNRIFQDEANARPGAILASYLGPLWQHSVGCAIGARWLAEKSGYGGLAEEAYMAGLIHDLGKLFLLACLDHINTSEEYAVDLADNLVKEIIDSMHIEQGLRLVEDWNLPDIYGEVIANHHDESDLENMDTTVHLVRLANKGCKKIGLDFVCEPSIVLPNTLEAQHLGINEITMAEFEIMLEDRFLGGPMEPESTPEPPVAT